MTRRTILPALCLVLLSCSDANRQAQYFLRHAEQALASQRYNEAKLYIDSIKLCCPKAYDARREGIRLMQQVELTEQERNLEYLDSALQVRLQQFDSIRAEFVLEKDTAWQEMGNYMCPSQVTERNVGRTFLRAQVSEKGELILTSIYCGTTHIHHTAVKVSTGDLFAQTPTSPDSYETSDLGQVIEKADFNYGADGGVIDFVEQYGQQPLRIEFLGDKTYATTLQRADCKAIASAKQLAQILSGMEQIYREQQEAQRKMGFIRKNMQKQGLSDETSEQTSGL